MGGNGGNANVSIGTLNLFDANSSLNVTSGEGDTEDNGVNGDANVTVGTLLGAGTLYVYGYWQQHLAGFQW